MTDYLYYSGLLFCASIVLAIAERRLNKRILREMRESHEKEIKKINHYL